MRLRDASWLVLTLVTVAAAPALGYTALRRVFVSESSKTTVTILQNSDWENPGAGIGEYKQVDGSGGYLTNTGRDDPMGFYTQFRDTSGAERCVGRMHIFIDDSGRNGYASEAVWQVDGKVSGFRCSTVGQTMKLNMKQVD